MFHDRLMDSTREIASQFRPGFARRKFLKYTLLGLGAAAGLGAAGVGVFLTNRYATNYGKLLVFNGHLTDILHTFAEAALPVRAGFPTIEEAEVVRRADEEFYFIDPDITADFKAALYLIEALPISLGYFSRFSRLDRSERVAFLEKMQNTENDLVRVAIANARMVVRLMYYGHSSTWKAIGYDGPFANVPEVVSSQRKHYASLVR